MKRFQLVLEAQRKPLNERGHGRATRPKFLSNFHFSSWAEMKIPYQLAISIISAGWHTRGGAARMPALAIGSAGASTAYLYGELAGSRDHKFIFSLSVGRAKNRNFHFS
jgi:hypothetical protein